MGQKRTINDSCDGKRAERRRKLDIWKRTKGDFRPRTQNAKISGMGNDDRSAVHAAKQLEDPLDAYMQTLRAACDDEEKKQLEFLEEERRSSQHPNSVSMHDILQQINSDSGHTNVENSESFHTDFLAAVEHAGTATMVSKEVQFCGSEDNVNSAPQILENEDGASEMHFGTFSNTCIEESVPEIKKRKTIKSIDHSTINYMPFRKHFYLEAPELRALAYDSVSRLRTHMEIRVRGKGCPSPISEWRQCGLSNRILAVLNHHGWKVPFAIQKQVLPVIMSGRDCIAVAKTGSGKTLAFLIPLFRHILDQPPVQDGDGPIALIMAPARELANQIHKEVRKFSKVLNLRSICCYGGSAIRPQIGALKKGIDIVVGTPGRLIDILSLNSGRILSLRRVTYVVLDEADRMFDMGFEPQVMAIIGNVRPDKQLVLFSATFPSAVEKLAKIHLSKPIEIVVGGRTKASSDIIQFVEVRRSVDKFPRLLQLLGLWYEKGNILVFVDTQKACDALFQALTNAGYYTLSLHGGKDQIDRDYTIQEYKQKVCTLMVATSVAGRGLDVPDLCLVVNYVVPDHIEDYIHRIGRTGRAGKKGTAYTFITPDESKYSPDLVRALSEANQNVPTELSKMCEEFKKQVKRGDARYRSSGYRGSGFTFEANEREGIHAERELIRKEYEVAAGLVAPEEHHSTEINGDYDDCEKVAMGAASEAVPMDPSDGFASAAIRQAMAIAATFQSKHNKSLSNPQTAKSSFPINDLPQQMRYMLSKREVLESVMDVTKCLVECRGTYVPPGRKRGGATPLYLFIEGPSEFHVTRALEEVKRRASEAVASSIAPGTSSRYAVV